MISSFISLAIISLLMLCFKQTQWLGFVGAAVLGLIFPIATSVIAVVVGAGLFFFKRR